MCLRTTFQQQLPSGICFSHNFIIDYHPGYHLLCQSCTVEGPTNAGNLWMNNFKTNLNVNNSIICWISRGCKPECTQFSVPMTVNFRLHHGSCSSIMGSSTSDHIKNVLSKYKQLQKAVCVQDYRLKGIFSKQEKHTKDIGLYTWAHTVHWHTKNKNNVFVLVIPTVWNEFIASG